MLSAAMLNQFVSRPANYPTFPSDQSTPRTLSIPVATAAGGVYGLPSAAIMPRRKGYKQVEQITYVGAATVASSASTTVTLNHPALARTVTVTVAIANNASASTIGGNVRTALNAALTTEEKAAVCTVTGSGAVVSVTAADFLDDVDDFTLSATITGATVTAVQQDAGTLGVFGETLTQGVAQAASITYATTATADGSTVITLTHPLFTRDISLTVAITTADTATVIGNAIRAALTAAMTTAEKNIVTIGGTAGNVTATAVRAAANTTAFVFTGTEPAGDTTYTANASTAGVLGTVPDFVGQLFIADAVVYSNTSDLLNTWTQISN